MSSFINPFNSILYRHNSAGCRYFGCCLNQTDFFFLSMWWCRTSDSHLCSFFKCIYFGVVFWPFALIFMQRGRRHAANGRGWSLTQSTGHARLPQDILTSHLISKGSFATSFISFLQHFGELIFFPHSLNAPSHLCCFILGVTDAFGHTTSLGVQFLGCQLVCNLQFGRALCVMIT